MTCPDICTAAKCEELENRIGALEQALELLEAAFEAHTGQGIPEAHTYEPPEPPDLSGYCTVAECGEIYQGLQLLEASFEAHTGQGIPEAHTYEPPEPEPPDLSGYCTVAECGEIYQGLQLLEASFEAHTGQSIPEAHAYQPPEPEPPSVSLSITNNGNNDFTIVVTVDGIRGEDLLSIATIQGEQGPPGEQGEPGEDVNCNNLSQEFQDCCSQIISAIDSLGNLFSGLLDNAENNLKNEIDSAQINLNNRIDVVENYVTIDISDTINSQYKCAENEETNVIEPVLVPTNYSNKGLLGLHEHLKLMSANMDAIFKPLCEVQNETVVSLVASDKVLDRHQGKTLVLQLVTFDNYPKRNAGSSYWQQQIPNPRDNYTWNDDFKNLVWNRGNFYCELYLIGIRDPVSGWFADKDAADNWFNSILTLTTAQERNRKYHEQKTPLRNITPNIVRPYRAFITSINDAGKGVCEVKYVPSIVNE